MTLLIRAAALVGYKDLAHAVGANADAELALAGLSDKAVNDLDNFISYHSFVRLLEHTATASGCRDFGLQLARIQDEHMLGPLTVLMRHAASLQEALGLAARYVYVLSPAIGIEVAPAADDPLSHDVIARMDLRPPRNLEQTIEHMLGSMIGVLRFVTHGQVQPELVMVPHPRLGPASSYTRTFGCECRFNQPLAAVRLASKELATPLPGHDALLRQMAQHYIDKHFREPDQLLTNHVRSLLKKYLDVGLAGQAEIGQLLGVHPKTLQRRLQSEGVQFQDLLDEVRRDRFVELLARKESYNLAQLALLTGYSEQAALTRSCKRWFGRTPSEMRQNPSGLPHRA